MPNTQPLPPKVGHILRLAEIIREVDGSHDKSAAALAEAILSHPKIGAVLSAEPQAGPTDEEIRCLADFDHDFDSYDQKDDQGNESVVWECYDQSLIAFARAVLARWGRQP